MTRSPLARAGLLATAVALLAVGCSKSSDTATPASTGTTAPATTAPATSRPPSTGTSTTGTKPPGTTTTTTATTTSSTAGAPTTAPDSATTLPPLPTTPDGYASALIDAWVAGNPAAAAQVADPAAVSTLFALPVQQPVGKLECSGAAGSTICRYTAGSSVILVRVRNLTGGLPMQVTEVKITGAGG